MEQTTAPRSTHSPTKRQVTQSHSIVDLAKITQRNEVRMREMVREAKENERSGKTTQKDFENHRQCRFCYEEQYLNRIESSKQAPNNKHENNIQQPGTSTAENSSNKLKYLGELIAPCLCRGTLKYIHAGCLKKWITYSRNMPLKCQLCQSSYTISL